MKLQEARTHRKPDRAQKSSSTASATAGYVVSLERVIQPGDGLDDAFRGLQ